MIDPQISQMNTDFLKNIYGNLWIMKKWIRHILPGLVKKERGHFNSSPERKRQGKR